MILPLLSSAVFNSENLEGGAERGGVREKVDRVTHPVSIVLGHRGWGVLDELVRSVEPNSTFKVTADSS